MANIFPYGTVEPAKAVKAADKVLNNYFTIARGLGIPSCLAYGLCLGFIRDGGYISGDNDLDVVAITPTNWLTQELLDALTANGFKRGEVFHPPHNNAHFHRDNILLDIFFRKPETYYGVFDTVMYGGGIYPVPYPVEDYLVANYDNWKVKADRDGKVGL